MNFDRAALLLLVLLLPLAGAGGAVVVQPSELIYLPERGGLVRIRDRTFQEVDSFRIPGVEDVTGSVFNSAGNLVAIARREDGVYVVEVTPRGELVREYRTGRGTLLLGSYIDFHVPTQTYLFADDDRVTLLDGSLELIGSSEALFDRASGVGFGPDGSLYATAQFEDLIYRFDRSFRLRDRIPFSGWVNTGFEVEGWSLWGTSFGDGAVTEVNLLNGSARGVVSGLGWGGVTDLALLPDGTFLTIGNELRHYRRDGVLLASMPAEGDSLAVLIVPEPGVPNLLALAGGWWLFGGRRRTGNRMFGGRLRDCQGKRDHGTRRARQRGSDGSAEALK